MHRVRIKGITVGLAASLAGLLVVVAPGAQAGAPLPGPNVKIETDSASIDTFQALNSTVTRSRDKSRNDFVGFGENLIPGTLSGPEGKATAFVSQASTIVTPSSAAFPTGPLNGIAVSGRLRAEATKSGNPAPGVPVSSPEGSFSADFTTSGPTPFQFDGALHATNSDQDDCTEITADLTGPINRSFAARGGGDCTPGEHHSTGFVITDILPAGDYNLDVQYSSTVDPENPGKETATGAVETNLFFFHRCSRVGTTGADTINGTTGDDVICGRGGNDTINGGGGNDEIFGGSGNDVIAGGGGNDELHGEVGDDRVRGDAGNDQVEGDFGDDQLQGNSGDDELDGNDDADRADGGGGDDQVDGGSGADTLLGRAGKDQMDGRSGKDDINGGGDNDRIKALDHERDTVNGAGGNRDVAFVDRRDRVRGVERINP